MSKRLYCVLVSCCGDPSRNPSSLLDRWPLPLLALPALSVPFPAPLLSLLYASGRPRHSGTSALCRRKERSTPRRWHGQRVPEPRRVASDAFVWMLRTTPGGGFGFLSFALGCGWPVRVTSRGAKPWFMPAADSPEPARWHGWRREAFLEESSRAAGMHACMHAHAFPSDSWTE